MAFCNILDEVDRLIRMNTQALSTFSMALVVAPALAIFITAFLLGIATKFQVGLSLGILGFLLQFLALGELQGNSILTHTKAVGGGGKRERDALISPYCLFFCRSCEIKLLQQLPQGTLGATGPALPSMNSVFINTASSVNGRSLELSY